MQVLWGEGSWAAGLGLGVCHASYVMPQKRGAPAAVLRVRGKIEEASCAAGVTVVNAWGVCTAHARKSEESVRARYARSRGRCA